MRFTVSVEPDGRFSLWAEGAIGPVMELEPYEAEWLARELLHALSTERWTRTP